MVNYAPVAKEGIPKLRYNTREWREYWAEQIIRCRDGYKPHGGVHIPGAYYFYLNFYSILARDETTNRKKLQNPWYRDLDHEYFHNVYEAKEEGHGLIVLKARDKGFSYMNSALSLYEWSFFPDNEVGIGAATPAYVNSVRTKIIKAWSKLPDELRLRKDLVDNENKMMSGQKVKRNGVWMEEGFKSIIHYRSMDNPDAFRGERLGMMIFEEAGEMKQLIRAYMSSEPCFKDGAIQYGVPIIGGTSNVMNKSQDYMKMWYEAESFNLKQMFIPATRALYGFFEKKSGKSDEKGATKYFEEKRAKLRSQKDKQAYYLHIQEYPLIPEDSFVSSSASPFDLEKINEQKTRILSSNKIKNMVSNGRLEWVNKNQFEVEWIPDPLGKTQILYHPNKDMVNLDVGAVDSYFQADAPNSDSKGCSMIYRRWTEKDIVSNLPIAIYMDRPYTKEEWYDNTLKLAAYYNCKMLVEYNDEMFFDYFYKQKATKFLKERPRTADSPWAKVSNRYGVHMKVYQKNLVIDLIDDYIKKFCDDIYFMDLLEDLANFGVKNTDAAMSFGIALMHDSDNCDIRVKHIDEIVKRDDYLLPTFSMNSDGSMTVNNKKNFERNRSKNDPLGLFK